MILSARLTPFLLPLFLTIISCSYLPRGIQIPEHEVRRVKTEFQDLVASQKECVQCLDARVVISLESTWFEGSIDGYLKLRSPDFLKYVALNPLGQTQAILVTDGDNFHFLSLPERKSYRGKIRDGDFFESNSYARYLPSGFPLDRSFYLFTGRTAPGPLEIRKVRESEDGNGYWLELSNNVDRRSLILFDDLRQVIRQHIFLDREGRESLKIVYRNYQAETGCDLPSLIKASSPDRGTDIRLRLADWRQSSCGENEFYYDTPPDFEEEIVE